MSNRINYLYVILDPANLTQVPFTTKSKREIMDWLNGSLPSLLDKWFETQGKWYCFKKGVFIAKLEIPPMLSKGRGRGKNLKKIKDV